jgi:hypothetical protein
VGLLRGAVAPAFRRKISVKFRVEIAARIAPNPRFWQAGMVKYNLVERKPALPSTTQQQPSLGVIDAVSAGLDAVLRHPWLLLIPLALDLFLWIGPRVQAPALYHLFEPTLSKMLTEMPTSDGRLAVQELSKLLNAYFVQYNLFSWLSVGLVGVPVVNAGLDATMKLVTGNAPLLWQIADLDVYVVFLFLFTGIGLFISALFWALLGGYVRGDQFQAVRWLKDSLKVWKRLVLLFFLIAAVVLLALLPMSLLIMTVGALSPAFASLIPALMMTVGLWAVFMGIFTPHGIALHRLSLGRAVNISVLIVRANFPPTAGLIAVMVALSIGMNLIWGELAADSWLRLVAMVGNAIIGAGLIVASMLFYRNRVSVLFETHHWPLPSEN